MALPLSSVRRRLQRGTPEPARREPLGREGAEEWWGVVKSTYLHEMVGVVLEFNMSSLPEGS